MRQSKRNSSAINARHVDEQRQLTLYLAMTSRLLKILLDVNAYFLSSFAPFVAREQNGRDKS